LNFDELETPEQAFWRKLPMEVIFGIGTDYLDCENMNEKIKKSSMRNNY